MAEFCLDCFNKMESTSYTMDDVTTSFGLCEGCGKMLQCVITLQRPGPIARWKRNREQKRHDEGIIMENELLGWLRKRLPGKPPVARFGPITKWRLKHQQKKIEKHYDMLLTDYVYLRKTTRKAWQALDRFMHRFSCAEIDEVHDILAHGLLETICLDEDDKPDKHWFDYYRTDYPPPRSSDGKPDTK